MYEWRNLAKALALMPLQVTISRIENMHPNHSPGGGTLEKHYTRRFLLEKRAFVSQKGQEWDST